MSCTKNKPQVNCVMVTQGGRYDMFRQSVLDFCRQTYPRRKLIIVSSDQEDRVLPYRNWVKTLGPSSSVQWHQIESPTQLTVGQMRNTALDLSADADYICSWDDDDRHHQERVDAHIRPMLSDSGLVATYMPVQIYWFPGRKELRIVDWRPAKTPGIVMYRQTTRRYELVSRHEDSRFFKALQLDGHVVPVVGKVDYYVRTIHAHNTSTHQHHLGIACRRSIPVQQLLEYRDYLRIVASRLGIPSGTRVCHQARALYPV